MADLEEALKEAREYKEKIKTESHTEDTEEVIDPESPFNDELLKHFGWEHSPEEETDLKVEVYTMGDSWRLDNHNHGSSYTLTKRGDGYSYRVPLNICPGTSMKVVDEIFRALIWKDYVGLTQQ